MTSTSINIWVKFQSEKEMSNLKKYITKGKKTDMEFVEGLYEFDIEGNGWHPNCPYGKMNHG
jgi:hypothetical protein